MNFKSIIGIGAALAMTALPVAASDAYKGPPVTGPMPVYAYAAAENNCPAGLQPVVIGGVICCGTPNQSITYQQANVHPVTRARRGQVRRVAATYCPKGTKGCVGR